jgi:hypothetical protein
MRKPLLIVTTALVLTACSRGLSGVDTVQVDNAALRGARQIALMPVLIDHSDGVLTPGFARAAQPAGTAQVVVPGLSGRVSCRVQVLAQTHGVNR